MEKYVQEGERIMNPLQCELTIDYDDFSIEVAKYTDRKYLIGSEYTGYIKHWVYTVEPTEEDVNEYIIEVLKKQPTPELFEQINIKDMYDFLYDKYYWKAYDDALKNHEKDDIVWIQDEYFDGERR